jgi:hypothetical protein
MHKTEFCASKEFYIHSEVLNMDLGHDCIFLETIVLFSETRLLSFCTEG